MKPRGKGTIRAVGHDAPWRRKHARSSDDMESLGDIAELMESEEVGDERVVRGARVVAPRTAFAKGRSQGRATGRKSDARSSRAPMTRVHSRARRYGDSSIFVGLPRKRHRIPPIQQGRLYWSSKSSDEASLSNDSARRTHRKNVVSNPRLINSRPNLLTDRRLQTAQASLDLRYARQSLNADWLFLVRFLKVTHAVH